MSQMSTLEVAELYGVTKMTVIRWAESGRFDVPPARLHTGTGKRSPYVFDRDAVIAQHQRETSAGA
jgi:hypothetical protein